MSDMSCSYATYGNKPISLVDWFHPVACLRDVEPVSEDVPFASAKGFNVDEEDGRCHGSHAHISESKNVFHF